MNRTVYEEEQRFAGLTWIWIFAFALVFVPLVLAVRDASLTSQEILIILLSIVAGLVPVLVILYFARLQLKIDALGIHYRFFPAVVKWRIIPQNSIESFEVTEKKNIIETIERGYRRNRFNNTIAMNISGKKFVRLKLKNGQKFKIGTENPESFERALKKLTLPENF
jgi:hypothetical protein